MTTSPHDNSMLTIHPCDTLESLKTVKVLGVKIDFQINFEEHVPVLCSKDGRQINVLMGPSKTLDLNGKLENNAYW